MVELKLISEFPRQIIALDEVGMSPLSGPVVIGAVRLLATEPAAFATLVRSLRRRGVKDSKALTHDQRRTLLENFKVPDLGFRERGRLVLKGIELNFVTWNMDHDVIDRENIFQARLRGMREAAAFLAIGDPEQTTLLIDGPHRLRWEENPPGTEVPVVKGDARSPLIGLASIIAKEKRDAFMRQMHELYPEYGFDSNVGYPTKSHREAISKHGPCPIHRLSFNKVKEFVNKKVEE